MTALSLRQLEVFVEVVEAGSFNACAMRLGVSQAAISDQMKALEEAVGGKLFDRAPGKPAMLTPMGQRVHERAMKIEALSRAILAESGDRPSSDAPLVIRMAVYSYIASKLQRAIDAFLSGVPHTQVDRDLRLQTPSQLRQGLANGSIDIGYTYWGQGFEVPPGDFTGDQLLALFVRSDHPLVDQQPVERDMLAPYPTLHLAHDNYLQALIRGALDHAGIRFSDVLVETDDYAFILSTTAGSDAVTCMFADEAEKVAKSHGLVRLETTFELPRLAVYRAYSERAMSNRIMRRLIQKLTQSER
ncbi:LysR family transcriptional regulator [Maritimibacter sp. DP07]|uniref:LysR family transcriptional regulator n=1 Tax=Maritimibacter harenae TaxID=2606218 RepID=A0A845M5R0_9RHOB|nr:LysR family transcriptional regulator [Maritimibacter harenae]MZR11694.1 LysR family transcriptional regulator [Maritimibacter harenae]